MQAFFVLLLLNLPNICLILSRAQASTVLVRKILEKDGHPADLLARYSAHCIRIGVATVAHEDPGTAQVASRAMNHTPLVAQGYQRDNAAGSRKVHGTLMNRLMEESDESD